MAFRDSENRNYYRVDEENSTEGSIYITNKTKNENIEIVVEEDAEGKVSLKGLPLEL